MNIRKDKIHIVARSSSKSCHVHLHSMQHVQGIKVTDTRHHSPPPPQQICSKSNDGPEHHFRTAPNVVGVQETGEVQTSGARRESRPKWRRPQNHMLKIKADEGFGKEQAQGSLGYVIKDGKRGSSKRWLMRGKLSCWRASRLSTMRGLVYELKGVAFCELLQSLLCPSRL